MPYVAIYGIMLYLASAMLNLEYRFLDASSDSGWSAVWFDHASDFQEGMEKLVNPSMNGLLDREGMVVALTTENKKTLTVGKVCSGRVKYINDYEDTFSPGEFLVPGRVSHLLTNRTFVEFWKNPHSINNICEFMEFARVKSNYITYLSLKLELIKYTQELTGATSPAVESAKRLVSARLLGIIDDEKLYKEIRTIDIDTVRANKDIIIPILGINYLIKDIARISSGIRLDDFIYSMIAYCVRHRISDDVLTQGLIDAAKSCMTLAGVLEDIIFYNDSNYHEIVNP